MVVFLRRPRHTQGCSSEKEDEVRGMDLETEARLEGE
jgi:hypothetical protein